MPNGVITLPHSPLHHPLVWTLSPVHHPLLTRRTPNGVVSIPPLTPLYRPLFWTPNDILSRPPPSPTHLFLCQAASFRVLSRKPPLFIRPTVSFRVQRPLSPLLSRHGDRPFTRSTPNGVNHPFPPTHSVLTPNGIPLRALPSTLLTCSFRCRTVSTHFPLLMTHSLFLD
jgi:hypothetical protein